MVAEPQLTSHLKRTPASLKELAGKFKCSQNAIKEVIKELRLRGIMVEKAGDKFFIPKAPRDTGKKFIYESNKHNEYVFGFIGDTHLCSQYERLDVLNDLYDLFEQAGVDRVFHQGNYIEGEAHFNRFELKVHGMTNQVNYLVEHYPKKEFVTFAVTGDDHEGWYAKSSGVDIGRYVEQSMIAAGRLDWVNTGFLESFIELKNKNSGKGTQLLSIHPGGGSAYALSYRPQKLVESFQGGEKPSVLLIGHYHKLSYNLIRNVHAIQTGCTQDQSVFMRKGPIEPHVGGGICRLSQDPRTGSIISCTVQIFPYYNKGFYNDRWGYSGLINLPERSRNG